MAYPLGISSRNITAEFKELYWNGTTFAERPREGFIYVTPAVTSLFIDATDTIVDLDEISPKRVELDSNGVFLFEAIITNQAGITPTGWTYNLKASWNNKETNVEVPTGAGTIDVTDKFVGPFNPASGGGGIGGSLAWVDITGKPTTFPPSSHTHSQYVQSVNGVTPDGSGNVVVSAGGAVDWSSITGKPTTFTPTAHTHLWADITDKPTTFAPTGHTHTIANVTGLQAALDLKLESVSWTQVTSKPTTFAPSAHTHVNADITDIPKITISTTAPSSPAIGDFWADIN